MRTPAPVPTQRLRPDDTPPMRFDRLPLAAVPANLSGAAAMQGTILLDSGPSRSKFWLQVSGASEQVLVSSFPFKIGRGPGCDLTLLDKTVSRIHAQIEQSAGALFIEDSDSSNGVKINGHRIERALLVVGDRIQLGAVTLNFGAGVQFLAPVQDLPKPKRRRLPLGSVIFGLLVVAGAVFAIRNAVWSIDTQPSDTETTRHPGMGQAAADLHVVSPGTAGVRANIVGPAVAREKKVSPHAIRPAGESDGPAEAARPPAGKKVVVSPKMKTAPIDTVSIRSREHERMSSTHSNPQTDGKHSMEVASPRSDARASSEAAAESIAQTARQAYLAGNGGRALEMLAALERSARTEAPRTVASNLKSRLGALMDAYSVGEDAYRNDRKDEAFKQWMDLLETERNLFPRSRSHYARTVAARVADEYLRLGNQARGENRFQDAYRMWMRAIRVDPGNGAGVALEQLRGRAQSLFREGYRLESVNIDRAKQCWSQVLTLMPPESEYYIKASAKLAWYQRHER